MSSLQFPLATYRQSEVAQIPFGSHPPVQPAVEPDPSAAREILVISADPELSASVSNGLGRTGFNVTTVADSTEGLAQAFNGAYALAIVDAVLPILDGFGLIQELRTRSRVPILLIASCDEHCPKALEAGADDFALRPVAAGELLTRSRALLRKNGLISTPASTVLKCDDLSINVKTHEAFLGDQPLPLTNIEFAILKSLVRSAGKIVSRDELATVLYQRKSTPFERSIDVHISHLRKKIEAAGKPCIRTIRGVGYLLAVAN